MEEERGNIIKAITTPLGFFALSLLIVEGFLGIVLGVTKVQNEWFYFLGMIIGALLFFLVVLGVWLLVWYNPQNIVKAGNDYIESEKIEAELAKTVKYRLNSKNTTKKIKLNNYYEDILGDSFSARRRNYFYDNRNRDDSADIYRGNFE